MEQKGCQLLLPLTTLSNFALQSQKLTTHNELYRKL